MDMVDPGTYVCLPRSGQILSHAASATWPERFFPSTWPCTFAAAEMELEVCLQDDLSAVLPRSGSDFHSNVHFLVQPSQVLIS